MARTGGPRHLIIFIFLIIFSFQLLGFHSHSQVLTVPIRESNLMGFRLGNHRVSRTMDDQVVSASRNLNETPKTSRAGGSAGLGADDDDG